MRKFLISTTALSVALAPVGTVPGFAQTLLEDGSVVGPDGSVLCVPSGDAACDIDAIFAEIQAAEELRLQQEAEAAAAEELRLQQEAEAAAAEELRLQQEAEAAAAEELRLQQEAEATAAEELRLQQEAEAETLRLQLEAEAAAAEELRLQQEAEAAAAEELRLQQEAEAAAAEELRLQQEAEAAAAEELRLQQEAEAAAAAAAIEEVPVIDEFPVVEDLPPIEEPLVVEEALPLEEALTLEEALAIEEAQALEEAPVIEDIPVIEDLPPVEETVVTDGVLVPEEALGLEGVPVVDELPVVEEVPVIEEIPAIEDIPTYDYALPVADSLFDVRTGEIIDPEAAAAAVAEAEEELDISDTGELIDPVLGLAVAEPETLEVIEPVDIPVITETEVEGLSDLLTGPPTELDLGAIAAAETILDPVVDDGGPLVIPPAPAADLIGELTETITEADVRTSDEEFAPAPVVTEEGKKSGLSNLEKAGLIVLGALVVGAIIKSNKEKQEEETRVVSNTGDRVILLRPDGTYQVLKDDDAVIRSPGSTVRTETFRDGSTRTIIEREDGTQVVTIRDATGRVLRRATYDDRGREIVLIDDLREEEVVVVSELPRPRSRIVISSKDEDTALKRELAAIEADKAGRKFSLRQIREIPQVRALAAVIDTENVSFASGSSAIAATEARDLADLGGVMQDLLDVNPGEIFLIEGHTDATGKSALNLALSDRRAESVALALTEYFDIPPENMIVQGYGETELLIDTQENEPLNRRVEVRVITPLLELGAAG